jgi:hypothetical protein
MGKTKILTQLTLSDLRAILSEEIDKVRSGRATAASVNAITNASGKILSSIKLELDYHKMIGKTPNIPALLSSAEAPTSATDDSGKPIDDVSPFKKKA